MSYNRTKIIAQALKLFAAKGYDAVGVQEIVEAVGVTKPTLYHYFGSKRGLFEAIVRETSAPWCAAVEAAAAYQGDITGHITDIVRAYFGFADEHPAFYRMVLSMMFAPASSDYHPAITQMQGRQHTCIEALFAQAAEEHGNMRGRQRRYAVTLRGMIDTYIGLSLQGHVSLDNETLIYEAVHQFMHGIFS